MNLDVHQAHCDARELAARWAEAHGLELIGVHCLSRSNGEVGVTFDVHVGHGDIDGDQRVPGALDRWRWSARMLWWRKVFTNADGRQGRRIVAREEAGSGRVLPGPWGGRAALEGPSRPARLGATSDPLAATGGCTCHLGGPFRDICPIHYVPGSNT